MILILFVSVIFLLKLWLEKKKLKLFTADLFQSNSFEIENDVWKCMPFLYFK